MQMTTFSLFELLINSFVNLLVFFSKHKLWLEGSQILCAFCEKSYSISSESFHNSFAGNVLSLFPFG